MALPLLITQNNKIPLILYCRKVIRLTLLTIISKRTYVQKTPENDSEIKLNIDDFTSNLIKEKCFKWNLYKKINCRHELCDTKVNKSIDIFDIREMNGKQLFNFVKECMENNNINDSFIIINQILEYEYTVPYYVLNRLLSISAQKGDVKSIEALICLHSIDLTESQLQYSNYFLSEAKWIQGNVEESIKLFKHLYKTAPALRNKIRLLIGYLISITIEQKTEATLIQILKFTNNLCVEFNDYSLLISLWQTCFLSEWYSDQALALDLLEKNENLRQNMKYNFIYVVVNALKLHKVEVVQRLFEVLLKLKMKEEYINIMELLFDYHCLNKDFRRCYEIIQWSLRLESPLRSDQYKRYLELFIKEPISTHKDNQFSAMRSTPEFKFKF